MQPLSLGNSSISTCTFTPSYQSPHITLCNLVFVDSNAICSWEGSLVLLSGGKSEHTIEGSTLCIQNRASVSITNTSFSNPARSTHYPSFERNILCSSGSALTLQTVSESTMDNASLWIHSDECILGGVIEIFTSLFFIPILTNISESTYSISSFITFTFTPSYLIPCNLMYALSLDGVSTHYSKCLFSLCMDCVCILSSNTFYHA